jgi:Thioredoxin like C-terminal domain
LSYERHFPLRGVPILPDGLLGLARRRPLPHVEAWDARYRRAGLVIVGVHTPEFPFEHDVANVAASSRQLGVRYPVAVDDDAATWDAYSNEYWPAEYLIDASGIVRHVDFGEGGYSTTETMIRQLLRAAHPGAALPPPTTVPDRTPTEATNPETYLGYARETNLDASILPPRDRAATYAFPSSLPTAAFGLEGTWTQHADDLVAGPRARLELSCEARGIYLVLGGTGTVRVSTGDGSPARILHVGGVPRLYTLLDGSRRSTGILTLDASPGVQLYDFTFS